MVSEMHSWENGTLDAELQSRVTKGREAKAGGQAASRTDTPVREPKSDQ